MNNSDFYGYIDKIRKAYLQQNYEEAARIADKVDFKRLKEWKYIAMLINIYEALGRLEDVKYFCILAYNRNLGGKKLLYKLTKVLIRLEEIDEAEELYDEFLLAAPRDIKRYELMYELKAVQGAKKSELIKYLEEYTKRSLDEKYSCILAELYAKTQQNEKCVYLCNQIIEQFEAGDAVDKALAIRNAVMPVAEGQQNNGAPAQNMYETQGIVIQNLYDTQSFEAQQGMYNTQSFEVQQGAYDTQSFEAQQGMYDTQSFAPQQEYAAAPTEEVPLSAYGVQAPSADEGAALGATREIPVDEIREHREAMRQAAVSQAVATQTTVGNGNLTDTGSEVAKIMDEEEKSEPTEFDKIVDEVDANEAEKKSSLLAATGTIDLAVVQEGMEEQSEATVNSEQETTDDEVVVSDNASDKVQEEEPAATVAEAPAVETSAVEAPVEQEVVLPTDLVEVAPTSADMELAIEAAPVVSAEAIDMSSTMHVDTTAINTAMVDAAVNAGSEMLQPSGIMEGTQDMESTMAMVEAALANETRAAQFDARMDMPEYSEEYTAPVKEKVTLRPFQPEIDRVYEIPIEVKRYFVKYSLVAGLEAQVAEYFESVKHEDKMGTSAIGNIVISGNRSSDKTSLAINIVKSLNTLYPENVRKIARTTGDNINQRGIERSIGKLLGAALIIEDAGVIDRQRVLEMIQVMESDTQELLIILEDSESEINELLKNNPELIEKFNHRISYKQFTVNELVEMCKRYADKCQYTIDEKALLQLYLRIDEIHSSEDGVSLEDVRDVVDEAIENAQRRASKKIFGGVKKKKFDDKEYIILTEADFK